MDSANFIRCPRKIRLNVSRAHGARFAPGDSGTCDRVYLLPQKQIHAVVFESVAEDARTLEPVQRSWSLLTRKLVLSIYLIAARLSQAGRPVSLNYS